MANDESYRVNQKPKKYLVRSFQSKGSEDALADANGVSKLSSRIENVLNAIGDDYEIDQRVVLNALDGTHSIYDRLLVILKRKEPDGTRKNPNSP